MGKILTIEDMQTLANSRGGQCLSKQYFGAQTKLRWQCAKGHKWKAQPNCVKNDNTWCPYCSGKAKHTIEAMKLLARNRGGECLSDRYVNAFSKLRWLCAKGHEWKATASSIKNHGTWCPICAPDVVAAKLSLGLDEMRELARARGGECLSDSYPRGRGGKLRWRCRDGHEWESTPAAVKHAGQWCPTCSSGLSERLCRAMFEAIFGKKFPKYRPLWLKNSRGKRMELDGYCEELKVAFEYHGIQHFTETPHFHRKISLDMRRKDDKTKQLLCKQNYVALIEVPYNVKPEKLQKFIYSQCLTLGIAIPRKSTINLANLDYYSKNRLEEMHSFAATRGGKCLANHYVTVITPVKWRCREGHKWKTAFHYIKNKRQWCPICSGNIKLTIRDMQALAATKGGKCLSEQYQNLNGKLRWKCSKGHEWETRANDVRNNGSWCPYCARVAKLDLEAMRKMAKERGGQCLSTEYTNSSTKLHWRCAKGHEWHAAPATMRHRGTWCPYCAGKAKLTIEEIKEIAKSRGGECLSNHYINGNTKLRWRCYFNHEWMATPDNVKNNGSWCPICANKRIGRSVNHRTGAKIR